METATKFPCACGKGALEVKSTIFGTWTVEEVVAPCDVCSSKDLKAARKVKAANPPESER